MTDTERLNWIEKNLFHTKENEDTGEWRVYLTGNHREVLMRLRGETLREAVDNTNAGSSTTV